LIDVRLPREPEGVVLVLHGGASRGAEVAVSPTQLSVLRMVPIARRIARVGHGRLAVLRLLNAARGWAGTRDAEWALAQVAERLGDGLPTCLVGHSLGGRAALLAAGAAGVRSAVALAPWVQPGDVPHGLAGQQLLVVHGTDDRVASPERSAALARALGAHARVTYVRVAGGNHAMLRPRTVFDRLAAEWAAATLLGEEFPGVVGRAVAGERLIEA
jgi:dienelactone hydrolase